MSKTKFNRDYDFNKFQVLAGILSESNLYEQGEFVPPSHSYSDQLLEESIRGQGIDLYCVQVKTVEDLSFKKDREMVLEYFKNNMNFADTQFGYICETVNRQTSQSHIITLPKNGALSLDEGSKILETIRTGLNSIGVHPNAYLITLEEY